MNLATGKRYATKDEALADGVPESDLAQVLDYDTVTRSQRVRFSPSHAFKPAVIFSKGSFKNAVYDAQTGILIPGRLAPK